MVEFITALDTHIVLAAVVGGFLTAFVAVRMTARYAKRTGSKVAESLVKHSARPWLVLLPLFFGRTAQPLLDLEPDVFPVVRQTVTLILQLSFAWLLISLTAVLDEHLHQRFLTGERDNLRARRILTRMAILRRSLVVVILVITVGAMLMSIPAAKALGASLLASAGMAGIVLGMAARPAAENLLAGLQIALTEPITLEDVVIVEGEWGWIEEITMTYVVVRVWDLRRLIVPIHYFIRQPFQNWTRRGADILGQVTVDVDYTTPVAAVRKAVGEIVESSSHWDKKFWNLQVVDAGERTMRLRVLATAPDSPTAWEMRCEIREKLIAYLQEHHPDSLPRVRAAIESEPSADESRLQPASSVAKRSQKRS
ncbi:MAG: mechanosensitive ion channel family protein [Acidiferrobacterales bacterium]